MEETKGYVRIRSARVQCRDYSFGALQIETRRTGDTVWQCVEMISLESFLSCSQARLDFIMNAA